MARPVYTTKLVEEHNLVGDFYAEVPAGSRLVIRDFSCYANNAGLTPNYYYAFGPSGATFWWFTVDPDTTVWRHDEGRWVFNPGDIVTFHTDGPADLLVSGYLLTLP